MNTVRSPIKLLKKILKGSALLAQERFLMNLIIFLQISLVIAFRDIEPLLNAW